MSFQIQYKCATNTSDVAAQSQKTNTEEGEIEIYKYAKQDQQVCCQCKQTKVPKYYFLNKNQEEVIMLPNDKQFMPSIRKCSFCEKTVDNIETNLEWEFMSFCNEFCLLKYQKMIGSKCINCQKDVKSTSLGKYSVRFGNKIVQFCSNTCLELHKKDHTVCPFCQRGMLNGQKMFLGLVGKNWQFINFCSNICWENYDLVNKDGPLFQPGTKCFICNAGEISMELKHDKSSHYFCGNPCFVAFTFANKLLTEKCVACRRYFDKSVTGQRTMYYDNVEYSFCSKSCKNYYIFANKKIVACKQCKVKKYNFDLIKKYSKSGAEINLCSINCLNLSVTDKATKNGNSANMYQLPIISNVQSLAACKDIEATSSAVQDVNVPVQVQIKHHFIVKEKPHPEQRNVAVMCQPRKAVKSIQATPEMKDISVQTQTEDTKITLLPVPVPIYIPTPCHVYSAPIAVPVPFPLPIPIPICLPICQNSVANIMKDVQGKSMMTNCTDLENDNVENGMIQMTNKPVVDVENEVASTMTTNDDVLFKKLDLNHADALQKNSIQQSPDANMCLKYTLCITTFKRWLIQQAELEKSTRQTKPFETHILQLTPNKLNFYLCSFVREVRKPNGEEYAPDTIYYLCLGIQHYLFRNGKMDNIFYNLLYKKFNKRLDEVATKFQFLYNDSQYITTRIEEEHLWECNQLGLHSPYVILNTLLFFNTIHFNLMTSDDHMQLSFSNIIKYYTANPNRPGTRKLPRPVNASLRFYPPLQNHKHKINFYIQEENKENPLRCPVKLYEFYLSKCPKSVRTRDDVFYLQPEQSLAPDSPVWFSTMPLSKEVLEKMLHRLDMVKEVILFKMRVK